MLQKLLHNTEFFLIINYLWSVFSTKPLKTKKIITFLEKLILKLFILDIFLK